MTLGEQIRRAREAKNLSQEALAESLGVSRQAVSKWENGTAMPQGANRTALVEILELNVEKEEPAPKPRGVLFWLGWAVAGVLLAALIGVLIWQLTAEQDTLVFPVDQPAEPETTPIEVSPPEAAEDKPELLSIRFYDETQEEVLFNGPYLTEYNMALVDSILLQWNGDVALESVKVFYTTIGEKTELAEEFKGSADNSRALLLPADSLYYKNYTDVYFELYFEGNYTVTSEKIKIYYDDNIELYSYLDGFDGEVLTYDRVEWVDIPSERADALNLTPSDRSNGIFYIYNEQDAAAQRHVAENCTYSVLDWNANYVPVTVTASEFQAILEERAAYPGIPYVLTFHGGRIVSVQEHYIP